MPSAPRGRIGIPVVDAPQDCPPSLRQQWTRHCAPPGHQYEGSVYYVNEETQEVSWTLPAGETVVQPQLVQAAHAVAPRSVSSSGGGHISDHGPTSMLCGGPLSTQSDSSLSAQPVRATSSTRTGTGRPTTLSGSVSREEAGEDPWQRPEADPWLAGRSNAECREDPWQRPEADPWLSSGTSAGAAASQPLRTQQMRPQPVQAQALQPQPVQPQPLQPQEARPAQAVGSAQQASPAEGLRPVQALNSAQETKGAEAKEVLPVGWQELFDTNWRRPYYVKTDTEETSWMLPVTPPYPQESPFSEPLTFMPLDGPPSISALSQDALHASNAAEEKPEDDVAGDKPAEDSPDGIPAEAKPTLKGETLDCYVDENDNPWFYHDATGLTLFKCTLEGDGWKRYQDSDTCKYWWCKEATGEYFFEQTGK